MVKKFSVFFKPQLAQDPTSRIVAVKAALDYVHVIVKWGLEQVATEKTIGGWNIPNPILQTPGGSGLYKYLEPGATLCRMHREWWLKSHRVESVISPQGEHALVVEIYYYTKGRKEKFASLNFEIHPDGRPGGCGSMG